MLDDEREDCSAAGHEKIVIGRHFHKRSEHRVVAQFALGKDARQTCDLLPRRKRAAFRTSRPDPSLAKRRRLGMTRQTEPLPSCARAFHLSSPPFTIKNHPAVRSETREGSVLEVKTDAPHRLPWR